MSVKMTAQVWELDLPRLEKLVALSVADWANDDGIFFAKMAKIAWKCQCSERTVQRIFESFRKSGLVVPLVQTADGRKVSAAAAPTGGRSSAPEYKLTPSNSAALPPYRSFPPSQIETRGDNLSPVQGEIYMPRGDNLSPVLVPQGVTNGAVRGDKNGVSRKSILMERKSFNVREELGRQNRAQLYPNCEYVENQKTSIKTTQLQQRVRYAIVGSLADAAVDIWRANHKLPDYSLADLAADLKTHAAKANQPYDPDVIDRAISVANERAKNYRLTIF